MSQTVGAHFGNQNIHFGNGCPSNTELASYLSEMSGPVYGRPAVEGVLHREVSRVWGALKKGAQGTDIPISACPMEREAAV